MRSAQTQLDRVDAIATDVQEVTSNASALSTTVASTFGGPLVKVAAFGYGVRRALGAARTTPRPRRRGPAHRDRGPHRPGRRGGSEAGRRTDAAMFRRTFWFTAGAAAGVWATTKVNRKLRQLTPESLAAQAAEQGDRGRATGSRTSPSTSAPAWPSARPNWARRSGLEPPPTANCPRPARLAAIENPRHESTRRTSTPDVLVQPE